MFSKLLSYDTILLMKVVVDPQKCEGCGLCRDITEGLFELKGVTASPTAKIDLSKKSHLDSVKLAIQACPQQAIKLEK